MYLALCQVDDAPVSHPKNLRKWTNDSPTRHPFLKIFTDTISNSVFVIDRKYI